MQNQYTEKQLRELKELEEEERRLEAEQRKLDAKEQKLRKEEQIRREQRKQRFRESSAQLKSRFAEQIDSFKSFSPDLCSQCKDRLSSFRKCVSRFFDILSSFCEKKYSLPLFIGFCFGITLSYINLLGIDVKALLCLRLPINYIEYILYLPDYSAGFCSRFLIGSILTLINGKISPEDMTHAVDCALIGVYFLFSWICACFIRKSIQKKDLAAFLLALVFLLNPLALCGNIVTVGTIDVFILFIFYVYILLSDSRAAWILTPILCFLATAVHFNFLISFFPAIFSILFYKALRQDDPVKNRTKNICNFAVTAFVTVGSVFYFVFFANKTVKMDSDEFFRFLVGKFDIGAYDRAKLIQLTGFPEGLNKAYFDFYLFGIKDGSNLFESSGMKYWKIIPTIIGLVQEDIRAYLSSPVFLFVIRSLTPCLLFFSVLWLLCVIKSKGLHKLPFILFLCLPLPFFASFILSSDLWRFASSAFISEFCILFCLLRNEDETVLSLFRSKKLSSPILKILLILLSIFLIAFALKK